MKKSEIQKEMQQHGEICAKMIEQMSETPAFQDIIRDWFAAQAISNIPISNESAKLAYDVADAMMKERERRKTKKHAAR